MVHIFFVVMTLLSQIHFPQEVPPANKFPKKIPSIKLQKILLRRTTPILHPLPKKRQVGSFGITKAKILRFGWEFHGTPGDKIRAADGGQVIFSGWIYEYGYSVLIKSDKDFIFFYTGNIYSSVQVGDVVAKGSFLGKVRNEGNVFFAVFCKGWPIDPQYLLHTGDWWNLKQQ